MKIANEEPLLKRSKTESKKPGIVPKQKKSRKIKVEYLDSPLEWNPTISEQIMLKPVLVKEDNLMFEDTFPDFN